MGPTVERENIFPLLEIEHLPLGHPSRSSSLYQLTYLTKISPSTLCIFICFNNKEKKKHNISPALFVCGVCLALREGRMFISLNTLCGIKFMQIAF
jgi:hypothetical protein